MKKSLESLNKLRAAFRKGPPPALPPASLEELKSRWKEQAVEEAPYVLEQKAQHEHDEEDLK